MQSLTAIDDLSAKKAEQQAEIIDRKMSGIRQEIDRLARSPSNSPLQPGYDPTHRSKYLLDHIHLIDFGQAERAVRVLLEASPCVGMGRAGLLLVRRCVELNGRRCAVRVRELLSARTGSGRFTHYPIDLQTAGRTGPADLLHQLERYLDISPADRSEDQRLALVCTTLCGSLQGGSVVLIQIDACDYLIEGYPDSLRWLVTAFSCRLLADLETAARRLPGGVTVVGLLMFKRDIPLGVLPMEHCCSAEAFARDRLLKVELTPWTRDEVETWLACYGVPDRYPPETTRRLAGDIVESAARNPVLIENELLELCATL